MLIYGIALALGILGTGTAFLMVITIVGICKFATCYHAAFQRIGTLKPIAGAQQISTFYLAGLNKFLGSDVGLRQSGAVERTKLHGLYLEHLLLIYWIGATILVLSFRPVESLGHYANSLMEAAAFIVLLTINVLSDAVSLIWTKRCFTLIVSDKQRGGLSELTFFKILFQDLAVAVVLMFVVQLISNGLYAIQVRKPELFFVYMFDFRTAFRLYAPIDPGLSYIKFPGQLVITCSTYLPSLCFYIFSITIYALLVMYKLLMSILSFFNIDNAFSCCSQQRFFAMLAGTGGFAATCMTLAINAWSMLTRQ